MSVLIKGMDMPRYCGECPCLLKIPSLCLCKCMLTATSIKYGEEDLKDILCPLTKVTELKLEKDAFVSVENGGVVYFRESEE